MDKEFEIKSGGLFYIGEDAGHNNAYISYQPAGEGCIAVVKTYVDDSLRGQGVAGKLLETVVDYARREGLRIYPKCSYVEKKFDQAPDRYADVDAR